MSYDKGARLTDDEIMVPEGPLLICNKTLASRETIFLTGDAI